MIGEEIRASVFRDTKSYYEQVPPDSVAHQLITFAQMYAGNEILDLGCASGNYSRRLAAMGYKVKGADVNPRYVQIARERGVDAYLIEGTLPFPDRSFDSVIVFEVLEHLPDPVQVINEAKRVARKNVLFTTPNSEGTAALQRNGLLFEHFADLDHKNFFTEESLHTLLDAHFARVKVQKGDGINPLSLMPSGAIRIFGKILTRLKLLRPQFYFRLFAVAEV
jgi:2-polyprenyl-3-methyl-5-hydroxy-6-metoxy-1,4-benzoquinol methylase